MSTIDPGMQDTVTEAEHDAKAKHGSGDMTDDADANQAEAFEEEAEEAEEQEEYREPSRWWFASTACPLLAGTFGPIASGFNICALAINWRVYIPPQGTEEHGVRIADPPWLIAVNAVSLLAALVANASLLLNMARRLRFNIAQPITISGFGSAGVLLIADMAAMVASPNYHLTGEAQPSANHALTQAFYYAIFASSLYIIISILMCLTVYGATKDYYENSFRLTDSQRTLMLQTMMFIGYLLLGALVFSEIEGWNYLVGVYWADVTLLTVGIGDYSPSTNVGRGLMFPFAIGGILMVGLVVGSIRSLVLERGKEKLGARITEKRRSAAIHNVDERRQTIKVSWFAAADFSTDPGLSPAQRREEEFNVMRKVQAVAEGERRWFALLMSASFVLFLWFVGAAIFMVAEKNQQWTYFNALYFSYICLLTIGYGDLRPDSNAGRAFFVFWSLLAVPSLTILISNMGDTIVKAFSDLTIWIGTITVLPGEQGFRAGAKAMGQHTSKWFRDSFQRFTPPGLLGDVPQGHTIHHEKRMSSSQHEQRMLDRMAERLTTHAENEELREVEEMNQQEDVLERDINFYHYVLARECRNLQKDLGTSPAKNYAWDEWEYFLKLMGNQDDPEDFLGQKLPNILVPEPLRVAPSQGSDATVTGDVAAEAKDEAGAAQNANHDVEDAQTDGVVGRRTELRNWKAKRKANKLRPHPSRQPSSGRHKRPTTMDILDWSWLSSKSPLMGTKTETEWILERLSAALERELNRQRKGYKREPPIRLSEIRKRRVQQAKEDKEGVEPGGDVEGKGVRSRHQAGKGMHQAEDTAIGKAERGEA
ncbi:hypothetical protein LTR78_005736 [Recurvomyces mirabilis]|uniref:Potassium channel domain-containing protein n=1 Tax=Recurvomyces mirabilis TaxID=574656 RepID=A0AAE0WM65_9PEZI|nr:hypothetical protein LTR78_005736 [Recurvomyces mirabilis]KAK5154115.1 hypothetical protein LTS14_006800 [Recurvomyces mirabilis]